MTTKNTILISAATCLAVHFLLWLLGWMVWPIVWLIMGYGSIKVCEWTIGKTLGNPQSFDFSEKIISIILGPLMGIVAFVCDGYRYASFPKFPKIRNPFIWPND